MKNIILSSPLKFRVHGSGKNIGFVIFCIVLFAGIVFGAVSGRSADSELMKRLDFIFQTNYHIRCSQGLLTAFVSSFGSSVIFLVMIFLFGLSLWGGFVSWIIPFFKGYGYGISVGYLYGLYGFYGVGYNLLIVLPGMFISSLVISKAGYEVMKKSVKMIRLVTRNEIRDDPYIQMKHYLKMMFVSMLMCAVSSVVDMLFAMCFSWIFKF